MTVERRILVINPNSNEAVTRGLDGALAPLARPGIAIDCRTLAEGPFGIQSQADVEQVALPLRDLVRRESADAYVIACYSDPGLHVCREATDRPVLGIAECGILTALARADRFGVIAVASRSIPRHLRALRQMGVIERLAGERALEMTVAETASGPDTLSRMIAVGRDLRDRDGAGAIVMGCAGMAVHRRGLEQELGIPVIVMGCAGMAAHRRGLEQELGIPVIDPTQAAVAMAIGVVAVA